LSTRTAEQRQAILDDGSQVTLDAQTLLSLAFSERRRDINLDAGAAIFDVAHDPQKPFVVQAGEVRVTAIGTVFEVRHQGRGVRVTCTEGVVTVQSPGQAEQRLRAGEQLIFGNSKTPQFHQVDSDSAVAWQYGQLKFRQRPLAELIEELNRYRPGRIILAAADKAERPVSGLFHLSRPEEALQHIVQSQGLQAAYYPGGVVLLR
jgi:transmembrane sensor